MINEQLIVQAYQFPLSVYKTYCQILLFTIGLIVSVSFGYFMLPFVFVFEDVLWYVLGMVVPLFPSIFNMECVI